jgi:hypothetical protein
MSVSFQDRHERCVVLNDPLEPPDLGASCFYCQAWGVEEQVESQHQHGLYYEIWTNKQ